MNKDDVKNQIEVELKKREKSIRNKNAIEKFLGLFPTLDALWGVLVGSPVFYHPLIAKYLMP